jgi:SlyX protein
MIEKDPGERIDALEARLMFQEATIETLNATVTAQWHEIDALKRRLAALSEQLAETEAVARTPANERPPHY